MSPDGDGEARMQFIDCGPTCGFSRDVVVKSRTYPFGECLVLALDSEPRLGLRWNGDRVLEVSCAAPAKDIIRRDDRRHDVQVRFQRPPPISSAPS